MEQQSQKFLRRRKFLVALPLLVLPFVTLAFWAMGGGRASGNNQAISQKSGLNLELPGPNLKNDAIDKLGYYEKATTDSLRLKDEIQNDPYYKKNIELADTFSDRSVDNILPPTFKSPKEATSYTDANEEKVYNKLKQLNNVVNSKEMTSESKKSINYSTEKLNNEPSLNREDVDKLGQMMQNMNQGDGADDPEMNQMNGMLEKILDIQHPERISEKIKENSLEHKRQVYPVKVNDPEDNIFSFGMKSISNNNSDTNKPNKNFHNKFYSLNENNNSDDSMQNFIQAVIHETQTIVSGSTIKLRLLNDVYINGLLIPKDNFIFGTATMNADRLVITIKSIRYKNNLLPVNLSVFDMDGMEGIYIPESITKDVANQTSNNALQNIGLNSLNPTISAQAITAGIEAGKNLLSKKIKLIKVTVKAGYQLLLKNNNTEQSNF